MTEHSPFPPVGFLGLGAMGALMAHHLEEKGVPIVAFDVDPAKRAAFETPATSPAEVAERCEWIVCMLPHPDVVRDVLLGEHGVAPHARAGTMVIDMSTTGPEADVACAEALATRGIDLIDGPVGKGTWAAGKGELIILAGGTSAQIEKARWLLELLGSEVLHCGPLGSGQVVKLANNIATCANLAAALEAYQLVQRSGADVDALLNVMRQTAADSWQLNNTVARALQEDYSLGFKGSLALKDLQLALAVAQATGADVPTTAGTLRWYERSVAAGDGDRDLGAIFKLLNQAPGAPAR